MNHTNKAFPSPVSTHSVHLLPQMHPEIVYKLQLWHICKSPCGLQKVVVHQHIQNIREFHTRLSSRAQCFVVSIQSQRRRMHDVRRTSNVSISIQLWYYQCYNFSLCLRALQLYTASYLLPVRFAYNVPIYNQLLLLLVCCELLLQSQLCVLINCVAAAAGELLKSSVTYIYNVCICGDGFIIDKFLTCLLIIEGDVGKLGG